MMLDGAFVDTKGSLSSARVKPGKFFSYCVLSPQMALRTGSSPALTFWVSAPSRSCRSEPPTTQFGWSWWLTVRPVNVFA